MFVACLSDELLFVNKVILIYCVRRQGDVISHSANSESCTKPGCCCSSVLLAGASGQIEDCSSLDY